MRLSHLLLAALLGLASATAVAIDSRLTYQGSLEESGLPAEGDFDFRFELQDDQGAAVAPALELAAVPVSGGVFTVELDFGTGAFLGDDRFLRIELRPSGSAEPYTAMDPPTRVTPAPYAQTALGAHIAASVAPDGVDSAAILDGSVGAGDIDPAQVQRRIGGSCAQGTTLLAVGEDGAVTCAPIGWSVTGAGLHTFFSAVGIGTSTPQNALHVVGNARVTRLSAGTGASPAYPLDTTTAHVATRIGVGTPPNSTYAIDAAGAVRLQNDVRINGVLNPNNPLTIGNDTVVEGTLQSGGRGLIKGPGAAMQRMFRAQVTLGANLPAGGSVDSGDFGFPAGLFSAPPIVMMGQLVSATGGNGARLEFVPFNTRANATQFRVFNHSSGSVNITATYEFIAIGPE